MSMSPLILFDINILYQFLQIIDNIKAYNGTDFLC